MTSSEAITLVISLLSLVVAVVAAYRTYQLSHAQLRLGSRHEFQKLLIDLDKELVRDPELWGVYDSHPMAKFKVDDPAHLAKLQAFAYLYLNTLDIVFAFFQDSLSRTRIENEIWQAWQGTCRDFLHDSSIARQILTRPGADRIFDAYFIRTTREMLAEMQPSPASDGPVDE